MTPPLSLRASLSGGLARWRDLQAQVSVAGARLVHRARLEAASAGLLPREIAVLTAGDGRWASGLFSEAASVIGLADDFERRRAGYGGVRVDFTAGLYFDAAFGANWWEYYFEPVAAGSGQGRRRRVSHHFHDFCAHRVERVLSRERCAELVRRYVRVTPAIAALVDGYVRAHWGQTVVGVHYRGTDKAIDARRVPFDEVERAVRERLPARPEQSRVFVATDEAGFLAFMRERFPGQILARQMFRSVDGSPIDVVNADGNHQKGLDAVVDCLLLSRAHTLVRTASNLGLFATFFNPGMPVTLLNPEP
ncbi:MAG: hypothetical protein RLZZ53_623 [Acidobacteriota bacterium]